MKEKIYKFTNSVPIVILVVAGMWGVMMADRGMIPVIPGVSIYEPGQKAIVAWNGKKEILILSTDVYADGKTKVLEILPLPAEPDVEKGSFESFEVLQRIIREHAPAVPLTRPGGKLSADEGGAGVEVLFHEEIGAHSITCVRANDWDEFSGWVEEYVEEQDLSSISLPDTFVEIVEKYIKNQFRYFVLDITDLDTEAKSVEPVVYKFKSDYLFFPLEITSILEGETDITLFLLTKESIDLRETGTGMRPGTYFRKQFMRLPFDEAEEGGVKAQEGDENIISLSLSPREQKKIHREIDLLFWGNVRLGVLQYHGSTRGLRNDLLIR